MKTFVTFLIVFNLQLGFSLSVPRKFQQYLKDEKDNDNWSCATASETNEQEEYKAAASERIAIIGSGITGSVAAFTLAENARQNSKAITPFITIFEQNPTIGGRITTTQVFGQPELTIDTCASTINPATDQCLNALASLTGLALTPVNQADNGTAVWNGREFVGFVEASGFRDLATSTAFKKAKFRTRYGNAAFNDTLSLLQSKYALIGSTTFVSLLQQVSSSALNESLIRSFCEGNNDACRKNPQYDLHLKEIIEAGTRDRFFGSFDELNELNSALGLASSTNLVSVDGGNLRLVDRFIKLSGAQLLLNSKVDSLKAMPRKAGSWKVAYTRSGKMEEAMFDKVIIAAPLSLASIAIPADIPKMPLVEFADTVVTHFTSKRSISAAYFNTTIPVPQEILTSTVATKAGDKADVPFFSFRLIDNAITPFYRGSPSGETEKLYKLVSSKPIPNNQIEALLEPSRPGDRQPGITWINREILPKSVPRLNRSLEIQDEIEIAYGLYYAGGAAQVADTVNFACTMGRNAAQLIIPTPLRPKPGNG